jgi:hypothetical protein
VPYTKGGPYTVGGAFSSANANNLETQYDEALQSITNAFASAFVLSGGVCTIHGGLPKQLDVTACAYYALQADNSLRARQVNATNFTTVTASTTYFLDYNPDGSTSWATSHSGMANFLPIASVTTDGSGNISVITDVRGITVQLFPTAVGIATFGGKTLARIRSNGGGAAGNTLWVGTTDPGSNAVEGDVWVAG